MVYCSPLPVTCWDMHYHYDWPLYQGPSGDLPHTMMQTAWSVRFVHHQTPCSISFNQPYTEPFICKLYLLHCCYAILVHVLHSILIYSYIYLTSWEGLELNHSPLTFTIYIPTYACTYVCTDQPTPQALYLGILVQRQKLQSQLIILNLHYNPPKVWLTAPLRSSS